MSPLNSTCTASPEISSVILAGKDSVPAMVFAAMAFATACSVSRCELMPTAFKNLRILKFRVCSSIWDLQILPRAGIEPSYRRAYKPERARGRARHAEWPIAGPNVRSGSECRYFEFKRDAHLAEHPTDLRLQAKGVHRRRERH